MLAIQLHTFAFIITRTGMASTQDKVIGVGIVAFSLCVFVYYTIWVIILPFVEESHAIHSFFLHQFYAIALPLTAGIILLIAIGIFAFAVTYKNSKTKKVS